MTKAALYIRLSKESEGESLENQRQLLREYCRKHGFEIAGEYEDEELSGLYDSRPAFMKMMKDAESGVFDMVICKSQSRFSRNFLHVERYLYQELGRLGIGFTGVTDGIDIRERSGRKAGQIYALLNEWYCEDLSDNVRAVLHDKVRRGEFIGSFAPYGYIKDEDNHGHLLVNEKESAAVKYIFEKYVCGDSVKSIAAACISEGFPVPHGKNGKWNERAVYRILENEIYLGKMIQRKSENISYKNQKRIRYSRQEWISIDNTHEPVVSAELYEKAALRRKDRGRKITAFPCSRNNCR